MTDLTWSPQQDKALLSVEEWYRDPASPQVYRVFGYAGTGKTTLAKFLALTISQRPLFAAYTGKAANVLREKGCPGASTLHSLLYNVSDRSREELDRLKAELDAADPDYPFLDELRHDYEQELDKVRRPWFYVNPESVITMCDLLVVDEVSMVDKRVGEDILSFGKKVLVLGDPAQLPPIRGGGYFTDAKPDVLLTEIHRQAADNPILQWATLARQGRPIPFENRGGHAVKMRREAVNDAWLSSMQQVLCGKNDVRRDLNRRIRKERGFESVFPAHKDKLVMLTNDKRLGVLNGTICQCLGQSEQNEIDPRILHINLLYDGKRLNNLSVDATLFQGKDEADYNRRLQVDYGYALTVHKSQGSQWDQVCLYDDGFGKREPSTRNRWLYTAITRAAKQLYILTS